MFPVPYVPATSAKRSLSLVLPRKRESIAEESRAHGCGFLLPQEYRRRSQSARRGRKQGFTPRRAAEHGFTLVELLVVIVIIGLLATIVAVNVIPAGNQARVEKAKADIAVLEQALEQYRLDNMTYPAATDGLNALTSPPPGLAQPERYRPGGYIKKLPDDPWGRPYHYAAPGKKGPFDIYSLGADGQSGGDGENADIYSSDI